MVVDENRRAVNWQTIAIGLGLQLGLALLLLKLPATQAIFTALNHFVLLLEQATTAGTRFLFGYLGGGEPPFVVNDPSKTFILAFQTLIRVPGEARIHEGEATVRTGGAC